MRSILHKASKRGFANHGWLKSFHSFSFAGYYDPEKMGFGMLRVINDDTVAPSMGFGTHPHENMEIISIPLAGRLRHKDTMGNTTVIKPGEIQIMSAGTGIQHSEFNDSHEEDVKFFQIWVIPKERGITPRYGQKVFDEAGRLNKWQKIVSPDGAEGSLIINQDAWFSLIDSDGKNNFDYTLNKKDNGVYFFLIEGSGKIGTEEIEKRDGMGIAGTEKIHLELEKNSRLLAMEVPL